MRMTQTSLVLKKTLGQHILHDKNIVRKVAAAVKPQSGEVVVEIGGGTGVLTEQLAFEPITIFVIELDKQFVEILTEKFFNRKNITIISGDILKLHLFDSIPLNTKAVITGNLPYNITSPLLFHLFDQRDYIERMVFMVQREVAHRITAQPGIKDRSLLSVICQFHTEPQVLFPVSNNCFYPKPKVESAVVELKLKQLPGGISPGNFFKVVKTAFGKRRKMLKNSLADIAGEKIAQLGEVFNLNHRPEELTVEEFVHITNELYPL